ncbi:MAG: TSUP family transporter [Clostridia bacterium]|nr:TSUP family transporter [Clostridia bacterium]
MKEILFLIAGLAGGVLAGMGMGGGTLTIPLLVLLLGVDQALAQSVNLVAFLPTGVLALGVHLKNKLVSFLGLAYLLLPALISTVFSSIFATDLGGKTLSILFGGFLTLVALGSFVTQSMKKI